MKTPECSYAHDVGSILFVPLQFSRWSNVKREFFYVSWMTCCRELAVSNENEILQILYQPHIHIKLTPPPPLSLSPFQLWCWWSMNRYNILNLKINEPWRWKCFSKFPQDIPFTQGVDGERGSHLLGTWWSKA